jgi:hypothetical protein
MVKTFVTYGTMFKANGICAHRQMVLFKQYG